MPRIQRHAKARGRDYYLEPPACQRDTAVEEMDHRHAGLMRLVEQQLAAATPMRKIETKVKKRFGVRIPTRTIGEFRLKRWLPKRRRIQEYEERTEALLRLIERYGDDRVARAQLVQSLLKAGEDHVPMRPEVAIRRQTEYLKLDIERQKVAVRAEKVARDRKLVELSTAKFRAEQADRRRRRKVPSQRELCATISKALGVRGRLVPRVEHDAVSV